MELTRQANSAAQQNTHTHTRELAHPLGNGNTDSEFQNATESVTKEERPEPSGDRGDGHRSHQLGDICSGTLEHEQLSTAQQAPLALPVLASVTAGDCTDEKARQDRKDDVGHEYERRRARIVPGVIDCPQRCNKS
jgi:hypothetical protein